MKICIRCKQEKDIVEFNFKFKSKGIRQAQCRTCTRWYIKQHYYKNKEYYLKKAHRNNSSIRQRVREHLWQYLSSHPCVDCGEKDVLVLEFDHKKDKYKEVGKMVTGRYSLIRVKAEIKKCEVRCANCHRKKTAQEQGWFKHLHAPIA